MDSGENLFQTLRSFRQSVVPGKSPQQRLIDYCATVLGSVERDHFDYKTKSDPAVPILSDRDKEHLAKAVSGFANSAGGVLIWGIEDKTNGPHPISEVETFVSSLLQLGPLATDPSVRDIDGDWIPGDSGAGGFALIYVPESPLPPHRVSLKIKGVQNHYYVRSGQDFTVATHTQLEDMFGRRPQPKLSLTTKVASGGHGTRSGRAWAEVRVIVGIKNSGRGPARGPFISIAVNQPYRLSGVITDQNFGFRGIQPQTATEGRYSSLQGVILHSGLDQEVTYISTEVDISERDVCVLEIHDLVIQYILAADGTRTVSGREIIRAAEIRNHLPAQ